MIATLDLVAALGQVDDAGQLFFLPKVDAAGKQLKVARTAVDQLLGELNSQPLATFTDPGGNLETLQGFLNGGHVVNAGAGTQLDQISASMTALFDLVSTGLRVGKARGLSVYHGYGEQLQGAAKSANGLLADIKAFREDAERYQEMAEASAKHAAEHADAAEVDREASATSLTASREAQAEAEAKLAAIRETAKAAASLSIQVEAYEASFDAFQKSLDDRVSQHMGFESAMAEAMRANEVREAEIVRLITKADSMIKGATTAGLGDSLEQTRHLYQKRMMWAGGFFFVSVLLLAASAIPLVAHILPGLFADWLPSTKSMQGAVVVGAEGASGTLRSAATAVSNGDALISLLGKIFLLFPATWLTQFFSKAYSEFFHLEREYAHKAALARSVEGFKKQAPKYEEEITTAVFFEVQSNPSKQKSPDAAEHPILGPLMRKFIDALPLGKPSS